MNNEDKKKRISELPTGGITIKNIKNKKTGKVYTYHVYQWREEGRQKSRYLKDDEVELYTRLINERKALEKEAFAEEVVYPAPASDYITDVQTGAVLMAMLKSVEGFKKREIFADLRDYVFGDEYNKVFILYGLRRTGKTTMIRQVIAEMDEEQISKAAFIQAKASNNLGELNQDLKKLSADGYRYVFIDEITLMDDFIEGSALLSDIYAASGMKIVLSGTDSLGFWISKSNELYDRNHMLHTTFIPYREFEEVLGIKGIDQYIRYGGTMSMSGKNYNVFIDARETNEYVDSAIAHNIQHSLRCYDDEGHFRHLADLYEKHELTSAINRVVEDINHRFTVEVLTRDFKSADLALSARNLRSESDILDLIDKKAVTKRLKELLEIKNKTEMKATIDETHELEIKEYLEALDLVKDVEIVDIDHIGKNKSRTLFTQAGLRYSQARSLISALVEDKIFEELSFANRKKVFERILSEIEGRMLEDIVVLETVLARPDREVFKLQFADGEYDMVVFDKNEGGCEIFEIKYSKITDKMQSRHLVDEDKLAKTEFRYGNINSKAILYRGDTKKVDGIRYINVEEYLKKLGNHT